MLKRRRLQNQVKWTSYLLVDGEASREPFSGKDGYSERFPLSRLLFE